MISKDVTLHPAVHLTGDIVPCSRPKVTSKGIAYYPAKYRNWKKAAAAELSLQWKQQPIQGALEVEITVLSTRPKNKMRKKTENVRIPRFKARGDLDNQLKSILDVLQESKIIENDSQIYSINIKSYYTKKDEKPITEIKILECSNVIWRI